MQKITPCLWFDGQAEEAARFYCTLFPNSKVKTIARYGDAGPGPSGSVMTVTFELNGQEFLALNGGPEFTFNEAVSFVVNCETQEEVDRFWQKLTEGGREVECGWLQDRYGLFWQIVPTVLFRMVEDRNPAKSQNVMRAMFQMKKLDIAGLERAYNEA